MKSEPIVNIDANQRSSRKCDQKWYFDPVR